MENYLSTQILEHKRSRYQGPGLRQAQIWGAAKPVNAIPPPFHNMISNVNTDINKQ
jgi:hypothetical protein